VASTLGVVIPPSLVLLLLGDAMMRAHTEAVNTTHAAVRIVNTQDVMRAALVPGLLVLLTAMLLAAWRRGPAERRASSALRPAELMTAVITAGIIAALLLGVALGRLYAVEAAAAGCLMLVTYALLSGQLDRKGLRQVLHDTMTLTGLLLALLVGATSFSLMLRGFDTDALIARVLDTMTGHPALMLFAVLASLTLCSFVLDAFEMIFLVVPLVMPPLLRVVPDAAWVAALTLLVLQAGFLLPPFGYAVLMSRALAPGRVGLAALSRALLPQLVAQVLLIAAIFAYPQITQWTRPAELATPPTASDAADSAIRDAIDAQSRRRDAADTSPAGEPAPR
jgi:TRAP-type mannitol/chloroaromatic compound transport system permease large subunit